jgi:hypothetical protein
MSLLKILDINAHFLRKASCDNYAIELNHDIEAKLANLDETDKLPYDKSDMIRLISSIEADKVKCLRGEVSAKRLYRNVDYALSLFRVKHPRFDYLKDQALNAYYA